MPSTSPRRWAIPPKIGYAAAVQNAHFVAAPLLAGAAIGVSGVIAADSEKFRWGGPSIVVLALSSVLFISCMQSSFNAAAYLFTPADLDAWYGDSDRPDVERLMQIQWNDFQVWRRLTRKAVDRYNLGVISLGVGAAVTLAPKGNSPPVDAGFRWAACSIVGLATVCEMVKYGIAHVQRRSNRGGTR